MKFTPQSIYGRISYIAQLAKQGHLMRRGAHELGIGVDKTEENFLEAMRLFESGDYEKALGFCQKSLKTAEMFPEAELLLGQCYLELGQSEEAAEALFRACAQRPNEPVSAVCYAIALQRVGDVDRAVIVLENLIEVHPRWGDAFFQLAACSRNQGHYERAQRFIDKAAELSPSSQHIRELHSIIYGDLRVYRGGIRPRLAMVEKEFVVSGVSPNKILHLLEMSLPYRSSGYTIRTHYILKAQRELGLDVSAVTKPGFPVDQGVTEHPRLTEIDGIEYYHSAFTGHPRYHRRPLDAFLKEYAFEASKRARLFEPDLIHAASNFKNGLVARALADSLDIPFVYELRGLWEDTQVSKGAISEQSDRYRYFKDMEDECLKTADAVITISEALREDIVARGIPAEKIFIVPNAVDSTLFPVVEKDKELAAKYKLGAGPVLGYISSMVSYEGIDVLIKAFKGIVEKMPKAKLLLVGEGETRESLELLTRELGLENSVLFTGRIPHEEILSHYSLIDLFVVPRLPWRVCDIVTPLKPYEAMSSGTPVVVSDVKALKEMIIEGETGISFKAGDADDLCKKCIELLEKPEMLASLAKKSAAWVREQRNWNSVAKTYRLAYEYSARRSDSLRRRRM